MHTLDVPLALSVAAMGCAFFYLSSPHQRWLAKPLPARPARAVAGCLSLAGLYTCTRAMDIVPAAFTFVTWVMLLLVVFPYLGALRSAPAPRRGRGR